MQQKKNNTIRN